MIKGQKNLIWFILFLLVNRANSQEDIFKSRLTADELQKAPVKLIPYPQEAVWGRGSASFEAVKLSSDVVLSQSLMDEFLDILNENHIELSERSRKSVVFKTVKNMPAEGYVLEVGKKSIQIRASDNAGRFYAMQTLRQLIAVSGGKAAIQMCAIRDKPAFPVRGYMVDVGRNFQSLELLKHQIDVMARYKFNVFQWHLTDRPAWRIESKVFPELTAAGNHRQTRDPGKYYTYNEIRELIKYAEKKQIQVIPEIDMPGHSDSFMTATGHKMESPEGMKILEKALSEFFEEIPKELCPTVHIGSDEVKIDNPEEFITRMVSACESHGREVIIWNPGLPASQNVIRQTWKPDHIEENTYREIDSWNSYINNGDPFVHISKLFFKPIGKGSVNDVQGGIICMWNDVNSDKEDDFIRNNPLYPSLLTYAWKTWTADVQHASKEYLTKIPLKGTPENTYFKAFEEFLMYHKEKYFKEEPFPYTYQAQTHWKLFGPFDASEPDMTSGKIRLLAKDTNNYKSATGNTIYIKDRFKLGGYYPGAKPGEDYYAVTYIHSKEETGLNAWIGFETPFRANRVYAGTPESGEWDVNGGNIWINDIELAAPHWKNPGWKPSKTSGWGSAEDQEIPWRDEELYWTRNKVTVPLKQGWNEIIIKVPGSNDYQNWMFTFAPFYDNEFLISDFPTK
ncbi:family 20 glycosylhydrolase [Sinomicrobium weinanense]|uniref:beta-N-acetylhexosaminidase n=1 Tax=Sinomicrobium weinanense TaxID=2842200 RepID=A0A926Q0N5_9FLAO|nr:family 20 glycosylhydrolase [Sinomicrobium weinanense]MBC9794963.1 family 20 glycosylhydrolase [Sinomicrobium weinanense]MBU3125176.1 beta-N-acetylhexosaminidase [Sinomicrobium weinanense]